MIHSIVVRAAGSVITSTTVSIGVPGPKGDGIEKIAGALETAAQQATASSAAADRAAASSTASAASAGNADLSRQQAQAAATNAAAIYGTAQAQSSAVTSAQNAAAVAQAAAASASSAAQQDLSGVTAAALHRSPNPVTALFVYDTSLDADGGAWTQQCAQTTWFNEALNGKWLGAQASESAARAVAGAATGDYFQNAANGLFYSLKATAGVTEVFRGNKVGFPRLAALVAEAA